MNGQKANHSLIRLISMSLCDNRRLIPITNSGTADRNQVYLIEKVDQKVRRPGDGFVLLFR